MVINLLKIAGVIAIHKKPKLGIIVSVVNGFNLEVHAFVILKFLLKSRIKCFLYSFSLDTACMAAWSATMQL